MRKLLSVVRTKVGLAAIGGALLLTGVGVGTAAATGALGTQPASDESTVTTPAATSTSSAAATTPAPTSVVQASTATPADTVAAVTTPAQEQEAVPAPETTTAPTTDPQPIYPPGSAGGSPGAGGVMEPLPGEPGYTDPAQPTQ